MSAISEACPVCGAPIANTLETTNSQTTINEIPSETEMSMPNRKQFEEDLRWNLTEIVRLQRTQPDSEWILSIDIEDEQDCGFFYSYSYPYIHYTNKPSLGIGFVVSKEQEKALLASSVAEYMELDNTSTDLAYCSSCEDDVEKAVKIILTVYTDVYRCSIQPKVSVEQSSRFPKSFSDIYNPISFAFKLPKTTDIVALEKQVERFNKRADKYGHKPIEYDKKGFFICGIFEREQEEGLGFFADLKAAGRNGDIMGELHRVISTCIESIKAQM